MNGKGSYVMHTHDAWWKKYLFSRSCIRIRIQLTLLSECGVSDQRSDIVSAQLHDCDDNPLPSLLPRPRPVGSGRGTRLPLPWIVSRAGLCVSLTCAGPAAMVRPVRPWPYHFLREKNGVAWILTYTCVIECPLWAVRRSLGRLRGLQVFKRSK